VPALRVRDERRLADERAPHSRRLRVTFARAFYAAGNTVITFSAVKQTAFLESVPDGSTASGYRWQLIANVGAALS
jgi:hypothetical protein